MPSGHESRPQAGRAAGARRRPHKVVLALTFGPLVLMTIGNYVATASFFKLADDHPLWLVLLNPRTQNLVLVATKIGLLAYFASAIARRMLPHPLWFMVGRWYGDAGVRWLEKRSPDLGTMVTKLEQWFPRWGPLLCILYPHPLVCVLAGASEMRFGWFFLYNLVGIVAFVTVARLFGDLFKPVTEGITDFGGRYWIPLTVLTVAMALWGIWRSEADGTSTIEGIGEIEEQLEAELAAEQAERISDEVSPSTTGPAEPPPHRHPGDIHPS